LEGGARNRPSFSLRGKAAPKERLTSPALDDLEPEEA